MLPLGMAAFKIGQRGACPPWLDWRSGGGTSNATQRTCGFSEASSGARIGDWGEEGGLREHSLVAEFQVKFKKKK